MLYTPDTQMMLRPFDYRFCRRAVVALPIYFLASIFIAGLGAQQQPPPIQSPEISPDRRVTFRFRNPNAKEVFLAREGAQRVTMQKDEQGVWSVTTDPLEPEIYGYSFVADGVGLMDPANHLIKPNLLNPQSMVHVKGSEPSPWDDTDIPHGEIHHHFYKSSIVGDNRDYFVYTPPQYDAKAKKPYPVLYLFHGFSDDASGWTAVGKANLIMDSLIAQGKAKPMVIVMPLGYGAPEILSRTGSGFRDTGIRQRNFDKFRDALFNEVMPAVEKAYRVSKDRSGRAVAGLSMGGAESLYTGLNALDRFAWVAAFSSGGLGDDYALSFRRLMRKRIPSSASCGLPAALTTV